LQTENNFVFTLPGLLNILFRGRWTILAVTAIGLAAGIGYGIVVKPLYRASAQIRPGIVAFTEQGAPLRGWVREDLVDFFESGLYWQDMKGDERFASYKSAPAIRAKYVPSAIQFMAGGDVITLTNLDRDPERSVATLRSAMESFNAQGFADTLSSDLYFTRRGIDVGMRAINHDIDLVEAMEARVSLEIERANNELIVVKYDRKKLELDRKNLTEENAWRARAVTSALTETESAKIRLASAEEMLANALEAEKSGPAPGEGGSGSDDPVMVVLKLTASREQAGRVGALLMTVNDLSKAIYEGGVKADSLQARITANEHEILRLQLVGELLLAKNESDINRKILDLKIKRDKELPHNRAMLQTNLEGQRVKLEIISPLEQVGRIVVSDRPVRPRKLRAAAILTILAFCGSLALVFVIEYLRVNREEITRGRPII
jgi:LPS O-antigen subunit length determinant protein (WzzB/FepE family)